MKNLFLFPAVSSTPVLLASPFTVAPEGGLRELSADRPDTTESPITVDAGHWQWETSLFDWSEDRSSDERAIVKTVLSSNLKYGIDERSDIQMALDTSTIEESPSVTARGFGDIQLRYKLNLWGNDSGRTALALLPFVKIPTGTALSNGAGEGGLAVPWSAGLTDHLSLGLMADIDAVYDD